MDPHQLNNVNLPSLALTPLATLRPPYPCQFLAVATTSRADNVADVQGLGTKTLQEAEAGLRRSTLVFCCEESVGGGADGSQSRGQARGATIAPSKDAKHVARGLSSGL